MTVDLRHDEETGTYRAAVDWDEGIEPTVAVVHAVLAATGREETELDPLASRIDADALDRLLTREGESGVSVSFAYEGFEVTVYADGTLILRPEGEQ
jgi:hypothetical protein